MIFSNPYASLWVRSSTKNTISGITRFDLKANQSATFRYVKNAKEKAWLGTSLKIVNVITTGIAAKAALKKLGDWYWDDAQSRIYLYSNRLPDNKTVQINWIKDGIRIQAGSQYVTLQDIQVRNFNKQGIVVFSSKNITVQRCKIFGCGKTGIQMWNCSDNIIRENMQN